MGKKERKFRIEESWREKAERLWEKGSYARTGRRRARTLRRAPVHDVIQAPAPLPGYSAKTSPSNSFLDVGLFKCKTD